MQYNCLKVKKKNSRASDDQAEGDPQVVVIQ